TFKAATAALDNKVFSGARERPVGVPRHLKGKDAALFRKGAEIYSREAHCATCHQPNGGGLPAAGFPPIAGTEWMLKDDERLIKLTLKGLIGPITVKGVKYPGQVPMTPFEHLLKDDEIAAVLTFARNSFGNKASPISAEQVAKVRAVMKDKKDLYNVEDLLKEHPLGK
ncbi:MAG TPA: dehydrogenase, partial [Verrucomicrobiales bacterium]|nr:dehydrogenase [Verrucomicrobiales bacterium]